MQAIDRLAPADVEAFVLAGGPEHAHGDATRHASNGMDCRSRCTWRSSSRRMCRECDWSRNALRVLEDLGLEMLYDAEPDGALVHGIRAALEAAGCDWRLILACDMPHVRAPVLQQLWRAASAGAIGAAPRLPGCSEPEPLPSLWSASVASRITGGWGLAARDWVRHAGLAILDIAPGDAAQFANVNTPDEWEAERRESR
jgi:molybdopterin-guanine dinucleotide biosynthesis protein A